MRLISILTAIVLTIHISHAQQYGWQVIARPTTQSLRAVEFADSLHGWTAGGSTQIFKTTDGGLTWTAFAASPFLVSSISMMDTLTGWCVGTQGTFRGRIIRTSTGGLSWDEQYVSNDLGFFGTYAQTGIRNITSGNKVSAPDTGKIIQTTNAGTTWTERTLLDSITGLGRIQFVDSLHGWVTAALTNGAAILRTTDGGTTWIVQGLPLGAFGLGAFHFIDSLRGWASTRTPSGVFAVVRTTDSGVTWQTIYADTRDVHFFSISFVDSMNGSLFGGTFYQGGFSELIYRTSDGGYTWLQESIGLSDELEAGTMIDRYHGWAVAFDGRVLAYKPVTSVPERLSETPTQFALRQNYPNPFNGTTNIEYEIQQRAFVQLMVYDATGRLVMTPVKHVHERGVYRVQVNANTLASGVYYLRMESGSFTATKQMLLIK